MDKQVKGNILAVRLYQDEDVVAALNEAFRSTGRSMGIVVSAAGMMKKIKLGYFIGEGKYKENYFEKEREIVSLTGNLICDENRYFNHLHVSIADEEGKVTGGHLKDAQVHGTGEIFIYVSDINATRVKEDETGLEGLKL
ncbi:MAG: PPC domain-containing DNA-binding protein [Elusimicrobiota bacterium]